MVVLRLGGLRLDTVFIVIPVTIKYKSIPLLFVVRRLVMPLSLLTW